jgi:hypothetical protein
MCGGRCVDVHTVLCPPSRVLFILWGLLLCLLRDWLGRRCGVYRCVVGVGLMCLRRCIHHPGVLLVTADLLLCMLRYLLGRKGDVHCCVAGAVSGTLVCGIRHQACC